MFTLLKAVFYGFVGAVIAAACDADPAGIRAIFTLVFVFTVLTGWLPAIRFIFKIVWLPQLWNRSRTQEVEEPLAPKPRPRSPNPKPPGIPVEPISPMIADCVSALQQLGIDRKRAAAAVRGAVEMGADNEKTIMYRALQQLNPGNKSA